MNSLAIDHHDQAKLRHGRSLHEGGTLGGEFFQACPFFFTREGAALSLVGLHRGAAAFLMAGGPSAGALDKEPLRRCWTMTLNNAHSSYRGQANIIVDDPCRFNLSMWLDPTVQKFVPMGHFEKQLWDNRRLGLNGHSQQQWELAKMKVGDCPNVIGYRRNEKFHAPRWLCKDPIMEKGGANLYAADGNNTVNHVDYLGRQACPANPFGAPDPNNPPEPNNPTNNAGDNTAPITIFVNPNASDTSDAGNNVTYSYNPAQDTSAPNPDLPVAPSTISIGNPSGEPQIGDPIGAVTLTPGSGANTSLYGGGDISGAPGMGGAPAPVSTDDLYPPLQIDLADGLPAKLFGAAQSGLTAAGQLGGVPPPSVGPGIVQKAFGAIDSTVNTVSQALNTPLVNALGSAFQAQGPASPGAPIPGAAAQLQESSTVGLGDPNEEAAAGYGR